MVRTAVQEFVSAGPLPSEEANEEGIERAQRLLEGISAPVSDEEAQLLSTAFGEDNCYGLSWTLLHLIETAPSAMTATYPYNAGNPWVQLLNARVANVRRLQLEDG